MTTISNIKVFGRLWSITDESSASRYNLPVVVDDSGNAYGPADPVVDKPTVRRYADEIAFYAVEDAARKARQDAGQWQDDDAYRLPRKALEWAPHEIVSLYQRFVAQNPRHPRR